MAELSPQAQAVVDAAVGYPVFATKKRIAAALRAAVEQTRQAQYHHCYICSERDLLSIAHELETHQ